MDPAILLTAYIVFLYSTVCHEAAHAWVAHKLGDDTAYLGGQVTLDPIPHIKREPIGMVFMPLFMLFTGRGLLGWASAPLDPMWVAQYPKKSAMVAVAGPAANILIALAAAVGMFIGAKNGIFQKGIPYWHEFVVGPKGTAWEYVGYVLSLMFTLNIFLAVLNLMPIPPLDGSNVPLFFLNARAADSYQQLIRQPWMFLVSIVVIFQVFPPIYAKINLPLARMMYGWFFS
jgi:Zn-dependent protease